MSFEFDSCICGHHIYKDVWTPNLPQGGLEVPYRLAFRGNSKLVAKLSRLLQSDTSKYKKPMENECEAENTLKTADVENPRKKQKIGEPAAVLFAKLFDRQSFLLYSITYHTFYT